MNFHAWKRGKHAIHITHNYQNYSYRYYSAATQNAKKKKRVRRFAVESNFEVKQGHGTEHKTTVVGLAGELDFLVNLKTSDKFITPN